MPSLSPGAVSEYRRNGYHCPVRVISTEEAQRLRARVEAEERARGPIFTEDRVNDGDALGGSYRFKSHLLFKWIAELIRDPRLLDVAESLLGPNILCWSTHWLIKEARAPQYVSWHQDSQYWGVESDRFVSFWLAVSPARSRSGCVRVLPGSHNQPDLRHVDTFSANNMLTRGQTIQAVDESQAVELELEPGEVALFDYRIAHASNPNQSDDRRIGLAIRYMAPEARQLRGPWDSATLVRGEDLYGNFALEPEPAHDFDPVAVEAQRKADTAHRNIFYEGAAVGADP